MSKQTWIPNPVRRDVSISGKGICFWCKKKASSVTIDRWSIPRFKDENGKPFELDHVVPLYKDGGTNRENLVLSCQRCNRSKKRKTQDVQEELNSIIREWKHALPTQQQ